MGPLGDWGLIMGIDYALFERLCELASRYRPKGRTLMLGRHKLPVQERYATRYQTALDRHGLDLRLEDCLQDDGYCETFMRKLGFGEMEALDFSDYEGATILQDLNDPVPQALEGQFDFIFDGGTIEHVFNVPVALTSVFRMLGTGGRFVSANGMNGWPLHGLYQFNPDLVYSFWSRMCGCKVHGCMGVVKKPGRKDVQIAFRDPAETGKRLRGKNFPTGRVYLYYEVERLDSSQLGDRTLQSDYETRWATANNAAKTRFDPQEES